MKMLLLETKDSGDPLVYELNILVKLKITNQSKTKNYKL